MKSEHFIHLQFTSDRSLQEQIHEYVVSCIQGEMFTYSALPSCRKMASMLGVSRNTVKFVYERLVDEGYLYSQERSGYFVTENALKRSDLCVEPVSIESASSKSVLNWSTRFKANLGCQKNIQKPSNWYQYPYPFVFAQPDYSLFPLAQWRECGRLAQRSSLMKDWLPDCVDSDDPMLIKQLQSNVLRKRGIIAASEEILITIGTTNSMYLLADLLIDKRTKVGFEDPGYPDARNIFEYHGALIQPLPIDKEGVVLSEKVSLCDYVYTTPSHQVPTNITMTMDRRTDLLACAEKEDFIIIEDDFESEVNVVNQPSPALKSLDKNGRVIYVGSLSKSLSPGLRVGYMVADPSLIEEVRRLRRLMYRHPPSNNQRICALFISLGYYDVYLRKLKNSYREKWVLIRQELNMYLPQCIIDGTLGGSSFWLKLPTGCDADEFSDRAEKLGVLVESGNIHFYESTVDSHRYLRMGFSAIDISLISPGIQLLASLLKDT